MPVADSVSSSSGGVIEEATLCGYTTRNLVGTIWLDGYKPDRFYRLVYRAKNGSGETHNNGTMGQREERRLMATKESRRRYDLRNV